MNVNIKRIITDMKEQIKYNKKSKLMDEASWSYQYGVLISANDAVEIVSCIINKEDKKYADAIHYPDCWDTMAYPTLASALFEISFVAPYCKVCHKKQELIYAKLKEGKQ